LKEFEFPPVIKRKWKSMLFSIQICEDRNSEVKTKKLKKILKVCQIRIWGSSRFKRQEGKHAYAAIIKSKKN
jgi:hypothetical protein